MYRPKIIQYDSSSVVPVYIIICITIIITTRNEQYFIIIALYCIYTEMIYHHTSLAISTNCVSCQQSNLNLRERERDLEQVSLIRLRAD